METPRRRSQNREEAQESTPVKSGAGLDGAENCIQAVNAMKRELSQAKKTLMNSENCVVNRNILQAQLEYLDRNQIGRAHV